MPFDTRELREKRHKLIVDARAVMDKADTEKRALTAEERSSYDKIWGEAETLKTQIADHEQRNDLERAEIAEQNRQEEEARNKPENKSETTVAIGGYRASPEYRSAFGKYLACATLTPEEHRVLSAGTATAGGYLYASEQFVAELIQNVTDATIYRQLARVLPPIGAADYISAPVITARMAAAVWTSELGAPSTDSTLAFGRRRLTPHPLAKEIVVSKVLLKKTAIAEQVVRGELARVSAEAQENGFMTGSGAQQPLGIFTASNDGISTGRDVSTGNTATSIMFDGLKAAKYELKQTYWGGASWIFHRDAMEQIAKLKDGDGRYLLQDSVVADEPDRVLGFPVRLSEYAPSTFTTGLYVGILGNHAEGYWIVDSQDTEIAVAEELYIRNNETLFVMRSGCDGMPVKEEAFVRVKLG